MNPTEQLITLRRIELETLHGAGPLAFEAYVMLRGWMDYRTGITGRSRPISLAMLATYCETHTPRGAGTQIEQPTEKSIRGALERLERVGMLHRLPGRRLAYRLRLAATAPARPDQTGHGEGTPPSTEPGTSNPTRTLAFKHIPSVRYEATKPPNRAHIKNQECLRVPQWLVDKIAAAGIDTHRSGPALKALAAKAGTPEQLDQAIARAKALRRRTGSTQSLNVGLLGSILEGTRGASSGRQSALSTGRCGGYQQEMIDSNKPPRPGESWNAYFKRIGRTEPPPPHHLGRQHDPRHYQQESPAADNPALSHHHL